MVDYEPPPFFKRGPAPFALLTLYVAVAVALMIVDARFRYLEVLRQGASLVTQPLQALAHLPARAVSEGGEYFTSVYRLQLEVDSLKRGRLETAPALTRLQQLEAENARLRNLLDLKARQPAAGHVVRFLYATRDPFTRRVVIDRGLRENVSPGQPVIDHAGVVGQVTRVFPFVSEVTLTTDKEQAVPVQILRNGLRSVAFGVGNGLLELRYMPANADVEKGDVLVTSGIDGVYLPGLPVAQVVQIERDTAYSFARILCKPIAGVENFAEAVLLNPRAPEAAKPAELAPGETPEAAEKTVRGKKRRPRQP